MYSNEFEISAPQRPTHYSPVANSDVLDIVVHKNVRLPEVIVSDLMDSDQLIISSHLQDNIRTRNPSDPVDKFTDCEQFENLASELVSPRIQINSGEEADKAARGFTASIASAYTLSTRKPPLLDLNKDPRILKYLLKRKRKLRKLWQVTPDPACKMVGNWIPKTVR
jgi:hypothetical protein